MASMVHSGAGRAAAQPLIVEGIPIHLVDRGHGPPTLLLHGIFDSADTWAPIIERTQGKLRLLAPDLPGFGRSGAAPGFDGSLPHLAEFIDNLLKAIGVSEPINVVGYDVGATYGLAWAVTHPERVRRLAIFNANFFADYEWHSWAKIWRTPVLGELLTLALNAKTFAQAMVQNAPQVSLEAALAAGKLITPAAKRMALRHYRALNSEGFRGWEDRLRELTARVPTMVCWGDQDPYIAPSYAERFGAHEVHHFANNSHWLPLEAPEALAARLNAFLAAEVA